MFSMGTVYVLEQRLDFLEGVKETANLCNWEEERVEELTDLLVRELIRIDNLMFDTFEATGNKKFAVEVWNTNMEELRHWLTLILGIKVRFI